MKIVVIAGLIAIVVALFSALVFLYRDRGHGTRMVKALAIRVGLSILARRVPARLVLHGLDRAGRGCADALPKRQRGRDRGPAVARVEPPTSQ